MKFTQQIHETHGDVELTHTVTAIGPTDHAAQVHRAAVANVKDTMVRPREIAKPTARDVGPLEMVED